MVTGFSASVPKLVFNNRSKKNEAQPNST